MALVLPILEIAGVAAKLAGPRVRASGRVKDRETRIVRVSDPLRGLGILPLFTASLLRVSSPPYPVLREQQQSEGGGDKGDYYVNMGYAIRTLREELPEMFYREPCFDIYRVCVSLREMKQQLQQENPTSMSFDDVSMERNKSFINALQELKSLRPQLYSAAEYCEKSYLHNEQKQIVLDNLKDYAVRALVNTVNHLGTVANKLTALFEQQRVDVLSFELNVSYLNQRILTCQIYTDSEGLKKQQRLATTTRHHKHYILPNSSSRKVRSSGNLPTGVAQNEAPNLILSVGDLNTYNNSTSVRFHLPVSEKAAAPWPFLDHLKSATSTGSNLVQRKIDVMDPLGASKTFKAFRSFDNSRSREFQRRPLQSKSMLVSILAKTKSSKRKKLKSPEVM
ncbi:hypothetical protein J5N97_004595 [Dioscorea zingiberensis]|uniref:Uncharacterized protein n=1 Tax=Dioscorea zingiberensis TaxID=325984 RepID=A0A9D5HRN5_9LILI|nr:hypothetical protein J5N97_004595 [Dioscorea zingiberensis]